MNWQAILLLHTAATFFMTGLIATIQILHYPLIAASADPCAATRFHLRRAGPLIAPVMLLEAGTGALLLASPVAGPTLSASLGALTVIWASTFAIQVPLHRRLAAGGPGAPRAAAQLVATNWIRTVAWAARALCVAAILADFWGVGSPARIAAW